MFLYIIGHGFLLQKYLTSHNNVNFTTYSNLRIFTSFTGKKLWDEKFVRYWRVLAKLFGDIAIMCYIIRKSIQNGKHLLITMTSNVFSVILTLIKIIFYFALSSHIFVCWNVEEKGVCWVLLFSRRSSLMESLRWIRCWPSQTLELSGNWITWVMHIE